MGDIADDLECPLTTQATPFFAFCTAIHSFVTGEPRPRDFIFGTLTYHSKSHPTEDRRTAGFVSCKKKNRNAKNMAIAGVRGAFYCILLPKRANLSLSLSET